MMIGCVTEDTRMDISKVITLNEVTEAIIKSNIELLTNEPFEYDCLILNGIEPKSYLMGRATADMMYREFLTVYIFKSNEDQEVGQLELEKMNLNEDEAIVYSYNNVLLLYWVDINANQKEFDNDLKNVVNLLML